MSGQVIRVPASCPRCSALTCIEWDWHDVAESVLHCRAQHANAAMCDFRKPLGVEPGEDGYTIVSVRRNGDEDACQTFNNHRGA